MESKKSEPKVFEEIEIGTSEHTKVFRDTSAEFNAPNEYRIYKLEDGKETLAEISFQTGPIKERGVNGIHNEDLIAIVIDRLNHFQDSDFKCRENALSITKLEESLHWLRHRTNNRINRGIEGTSTV